MLTRRRFVLAAVVASALPRSARPQEAYPSRPIRVLVGHAAGGGVDILARNLGEAIRPILGQPFVVENKPGANAAIATQQVATATPDGYTLLMASAGEIAITPHLFRKLPYDPLKDLQPVTLGTKVPNVLTVHPGVPARNAAELIALAKAQPGKLSYGSSGIGNLQHLNGELFNKLAGTQIVHVPYKGAAPQIADLAGGQITMGYTSVAAALSLIKAGKLRPIGVTSKERVKALPDVPSLSETPALASYELNNWFGLLAPSGVAPNVMQFPRPARRRPSAPSSWPTRRSSRRSSRMWAFPWRAEAVRSDDRYLEAPQMVRNGRARPTEGPGSGMRFAERALAPYRG